MTQSPTPEAKWTPSTWQISRFDPYCILDDGMPLISIEYERNRSEADGLSAAIPARIVADHNACQSIPGDPEMALRSAKESLAVVKDLLIRMGASSAASVSYERAALAALCDALKSLGYDGGDK